MLLSFLKVSLNYLEQILDIQTLCSKKMLSGFQFHILWWGLCCALIYSCTTLLSAFIDLSYDKYHLPKVGLDKGYFGQLALVILILQRCLQVLGSL